MLGEFEIIKKYFMASASAEISGIEVGIGDDAALLNLAASKLAVATDTLVEGVHFLRDTPADCIATRALCVNLSDFAAMGVQPRWFTLALTLPEFNEQWLSSFASSLSSIANEYHVRLVGGDTCRGPLSVSLTLMGDVRDNVLLRSGANAGDDLWVSGDLGLGAAGLELLKASNTFSGLEEEHKQILKEHFYRPEPQLELGERLIDIATSAIDISDGLAGDALHLAMQSGVDFQIRAQSLPSPDWLESICSHGQLLDWQLGGDDYQLLFTASSHHREQLSELSAALDVRLTRIGTALDSGDSTEKPDSMRVCFVDSAGSKLALQSSGYRHF